MPLLFTQNLYIMPCEVDGTADNLGYYDFMKNSLTFNTNTISKQAINTFATYISTVHIRNCSLCVSQFVRESER